MENKPANQADFRGQQGAHAKTNVAGEVVKYRGESTEALPDYKRLQTFTNGYGLSKASDKAIDAKCAGHIFNTFQVGLTEMQSLSVVATYLYLKGREGIGTNVNDAIDWCTARPRYARKLKRGIEDCIKLGVIERIPRGAKGYSIDITHKGRQVLRCYEDKFNEVKKEIEARRVINLLKMETAKIKRETRAMMADNRRKGITGRQDLMANRTPKVV